MQFFVLILEFIESLIITIGSSARQFVVVPSLGYIRWLTAFVWVPEIVDVTIYRDLVRYHWRIFPALAVTSEAIGVPWDHFAIKDGLWNFPGYIVEIWFLGIPLEEHLWIIFVTWLMALIVLFFYRVRLRRNVRKF